MTQQEIYKQLDTLTKQELICIIVENQLFVSPEWVNKLKHKEINIPFEDFWKAYAYKNGSKKKAEVSWNRLLDQEREDAMKAVPLYVRDRDINYTCMAATWINQKRWEGILENEADNKNKSEQQQKQKPKEEFESLRTLEELWF